MFKNAVVRRFMRRKVSVIALCVLTLFVLAALLGPVLYKADPLRQNYRDIYAPFSAKFPLGTDNLGRDTLARMLHGARTSLSISVEMRGLISLSF